MTSTSRFFARCISPWSLQPWRSPVCNVEVGCPGHDRHVMPSRAPALRLLRLKVPTDLEPIKARLVDALPRDGGWQFEPKSPCTWCSSALPHPHCQNDGDASLVTALNCRQVGPKSRLEQSQEQPDTDDHDDDREDPTSGDLEVMSPKPGRRPRGSAARTQRGYQVHSLMRRPCADGVHVACT